MDVRNCKRCKRIFQYRGNKYCPACMIEVDELFISVRDYVYDHPNANVAEVSRETEVEEDLILDFLKQGRLELTNPSPDYVCERCEKPITTGKYCKKCIDDMEREMKKGLSEASRNASEERRDGNRMHISDFHLGRK